MNDYYFILGVPRNADNHAIKEAFRKLCLKYHPDRTVTNNYNHVRYMEICEAYRVLSNKEKRARYDRTIIAPPPEGIVLEIKRSYKGHYPWFAAFAVVIVLGIAMWFITRNESTTYGVHSTVITEDAPPQSAPKRQPKSIIIVEAEPVDTVATEPAKRDTIVAKPVVAEAPKDSIGKTQAFIATVLDKHTVEPNRKKQPTSERNFRYAFRGEKLFVTYEKNDMKGKVIRKQVAIPVKSIENVYVYGGQLWITSPQKAIQVIDLKNGKQERTDFFAVRFNGDENVDQKIAEAFASLRTGQ